MNNVRTYIHYGASDFDKKKFLPPKNSGFLKPYGCFWASPVDSDWGWKDWCLSENFRVNRLKKSFTFSLKPGSKVLHIRRKEDLDDLPKFEFPIKASDFVCLDYEKLLADGWDAIELHITIDLYFALYGWDCDSICIMNPDIIQVD